MENDLKFNIGDIVYLKTDIEQKERMIVKITITPLGVYYTLACGEDETHHYAIEIDKQKNRLKSLMME